MADNNDDQNNWTDFLHIPLGPLFVSMFKSTWANFTDIVSPAWKITHTYWADWFGAVEEDRWSDMLNMFVSSGILDREDAKALMELKDASTPMDGVFYLYLFFTLSAQYVQQTGYAAGGTMRQELAKRHSPEPPSPREVMMAAFIAPEKTGEVREAMQRGGLSEADIDLMFLASYRLYTEMDIRTLWLRGVLDDDKMYMRMRELGYTDTRITEIIQGWTVIPGPMDLLTMVAHEAFEPDAIALMGLADEFPEEQVQWLEKQGVSRDWALRYWYSHWQQPSVQMGYEMLHRGVIDEETLDMLYRTVEIPPFWRDKLTKIAYSPYTRVDVRRMHDMGVLNDEELMRSYMDLGYDEEHSLNMMKFTIAYNRENDRELTKAQIISGYVDKLLTREEATELLLDLDYSIAQTEYLLILEDYKETKELQDMMLKNIQGRFETNFLTEFEARDKLGQLNLSALKIDALIEKWKLTLFKDVKLPSRTDLDKLYQNDIINEETWRAEMNKIGYGWQYTNWYFDLAKAGKIEA